MGIPKGCKNTKHLVYDQKEEKFGAECSLCYAIKLPIWNQCYSPTFSGRYIWREVNNWTIGLSQEIGGNFSFFFCVFILRFLITKLIFSLQWNKLDDSVFIEFPANKAEIDKLGLDLAWTFKITLWFLLLYSFRFAFWRKNIIFKHFAWISMKSSFFFHFHKSKQIVAKSMDYLF